MLTRRDFHKSISGLAFTAMALGPVHRANAAVEGISDTAFLNRLTHGATPESRQELAQLGRAKWLDQELAKPAKDAGLDERFADAELWIEYEEGETEGGKSWPAAAESTALTWLDKTPEELVTLLDWENPVSYTVRERPTNEVIAASYIRAVHASAQLREVITQFWHEHFSVNAAKDELTAALFPVYDAMFRENAFGNFRVMLGQVARSPVMLHYLNNDDSAASPANENYARELLELHTLGQDNYFNDIYENWDEVPGALEGQAQGYIDADVYEVARALTGWSIGDGRYAGEDAETEITGRIAYVEGWHDPYQKRILGTEFPAFSTAEADGDAVLDLLAAHPGTARFVSGKLLLRLGIEDPSQGYQDKISAVFWDNRDAPDQIAQTLRAIIEHDEFSATPPSKLRRPFEFVMALYRSTGAQVSPKGEEMDWRIGAAGWAQHRVRPPTGHSDKTIDWADTRTINGLVDLARNSHDDWSNITENILKIVPEGVQTIGEMTEYWAERFAIPPESYDPVIAAIYDDRDDAMPTDPGDIEWVNQILVASAALSSEFLFR